MSAVMRIANFVVAKPVFENIAAHRPFDHHIGFAKQIFDRDSEPAVTVKTPHRNNYRIGF